MKKKSYKSSFWKDFSAKVREILYLNTSDEIYRTECLKIRDLTHEIKSRRHRLGEQPQHLHILYDELGKIKKESYKVELNKNLDELLKDNVYEL